MEIEEEEEVEPKTYSLTFNNGQFILTNTIDQTSSVVSEDQARATSQDDVDVSNEVLNLLNLPRIG